VAVEEKTEFVWGEGWNLQRDFLFGLDDESNALLEGWEVMEVLDGLLLQLELALLLLFMLLELRVEPLPLPKVSGNLSGAIFSILASRSNWGWLAVGVSWLASAADAAGLRGGEGSL